MNTVTSDRFAELVSRALERMAFVITEPSPATPGEVLAGCTAHAILQLGGAKSHTLGVSATAGMVREVAAGMMGLDESEIEVDDHAAATVAELANVLGGELVMQLTAGEEQMGLGLPREASDAQALALLDREHDGGFHVAVRSDAGELLVVVRGD